MTQLLHVNATPRGPVSRSLKIAHAFLESRHQHRPQIKVDTLHLFDDPLPPAGADGVTTTNRDIFDRFVDADYYLFNVPMWNFGVPYALKQLVDIVSQPGLTFRIGPKGYSGLLRGKRACAIYT